MAKDKHTVSNDNFTEVWRKEANQADSRLFLALGVNRKGDLQVYPVDDLDITRVAAILRECADIIEVAGRGKIIKLN